MVCSEGRTNKSTASAELWRRVLRPLRGCMMAAASSCLHTRSALFLPPASQRELIPLTTSCFQASSRSRVVYSVPPTPPWRGWREPDSTITCRWMARRFPPFCTRTGRARVELPSFPVTQNARRALFARWARRRHIVIERNRWWYLIMNRCALFSDAASILSSVSRLLISSASLSSDCASLSSISIQRLFSPRASRASSHRRLDPLLVLDAPLILLRPRGCRRRR